MNTIKLSEVNKLEKRMGARVWHGVLFNRDGISNPTLTILNNATGREILEILAMAKYPPCPRCNEDHHEIWHDEASNP